MKLLWLRRMMLGLVAAASIYASVRNLDSTTELGSVAEAEVNGLHRWSLGGGLPISLEHSPD